MKTPWHEYRPLLVGVWTSLRSRRLEVVGTRKTGAREGFACLPCARPFSPSPTTSKRLLRRLEFEQVLTPYNVPGRFEYFSCRPKLFGIVKKLPLIFRLGGKRREEILCKWGERGGLTCHCLSCSVLSSPLPSRNAWLRGQRREGIEGRELLTPPLFPLLSSFFPITPRNAWWVRGQRGEEMFKEKWREGEY